MRDFCLLDFVGCRLDHELVLYFLAGLLGCLVFLDELVCESISCGSRQFLDIIDPIVLGSQH